MHFKKIVISLILTFQLSGLCAQVSKTFFVSKPGTLISMMTQEEANSITDLTLTGKINAEDFKHLRDEFTSLKSLDLSNVDIRMYTGKNGTYPGDKFHIYMLNYIPAYAFTTLTNGQFQGKPSLECIVLSEKIKTIDDNAFRGCDRLRVVQIRKKTPPAQAENALADSTAAIFIPLGSTDEYRRKKNWEHFSLIEGEPLSATLQVGLMSSLEEELSKAGIQPKAINFLTIEGKLDAADFKLIRDYMPNLVTVDLSRTNATTIPEFTFAQKKYMLSIELPHQLKVIGQRVFSNCGRLSGTLRLPATVTAIEFGAFMGCDNLRQVVATGNKITTVGDQLFGDAPTSRLVYHQ